MNRFKLILLFAGALFVVGCGQEEPTPAPTLAPTITPSPGPTATEQPPTPTLEPTETPLPTDTPEPSPTPISAKALIDIGDAQLLRSDWWGAEEAYRQAIENEPENALTYARLAYLLQFHPQTVDEAVGVGRQAAEMAPDDPVVVSFFILTLIRSGEFEEALRQADQIESFALNDAFALGVRTDLFLSIGDYEQADQYFQVAISISGFAYGVEEVELNRIFARKNYLTGNRSGALQYSTRLMENAPEFSPAYLARAEVVTPGILEAKTQRELIIEGLILDSDYLPLMVALARIDAQAGNFGLALDSCEDVTRLFPSTVDGLLCQGDVLLEQGIFEEAQAIFNQVIEQHSQDYRAFIGRGRAELGLENCETAEADLLAALEQQVYFVQAYVSLAESYLCQGESAEADAAYQEALAVRPFDSAAHFSLGKLYLKQNKFQEAHDAFIIAILNTPAGNTPPAYFINLGQSLAALNSCPSTDPPELGFYLCSGDLFLGQGAPSLAVSAYSLALDIDQNSVPALEGTITAYANRRLCDVADSLFARLQEISTPSDSLAQLMGNRCGGAGQPSIFFTPIGELVSEDEAIRLIETAVLEVDGIDDVFVFFKTIVSDDPALGEALVLYIQFISDLDRDDPQLNRILSEMVFAAVEGFVLTDTEPLFLVVQARIGLTENPAGIIVPRFSAIGWHNGSISTGIFRQTWTTFDELVEQIEGEG